MKIFEAIILSLIGLCTISLFVVAIAMKPSVHAQSPKASFIRASIHPSLGADLTNGMLEQNSAPSDFIQPTVSFLSENFMTLDYNLKNIREEGAAVPRIFVVNMPQDMPQIPLPADRKSIFFKTVLPLILKANDDILTDRKRLLRLGEEKIQYGEMLARDKLWLAVLSERYGVKRTNMQEIMRRVDVVPPSIALAQAAEESGWGTSRFTLEGNALFGQWTFGNNNLLIPRARDVGKGHGVRAFSSLLAAVQSYMLNLNTHAAYRKFRKKRQVLRLAGITGSSLVGTLTSYSERGEKYVRTIQTIIDSNNLQNLDKAQLDSKIISGLDQAVM